MRSVHRTSALGLLAALVLSIPACGGLRHGTLRWQAEAGAADSERVVVAPLNLALELPLNLDEAMEPVEDEIVRYLQSRGARVAVIWPPDAQWLWRSAVVATDDSPSVARDLEHAASVFARQLHANADYRLLVMPSLVYRPAHVASGYASWDGVRRRLPVRRRTSSASSSAEWEGRVTGLSLHVLVLTPEGRRVLQGWGGLDLVHDLLEQPRSSGSSFLVPRDRPLQDTDHVREGIALALDLDL